MAGRDLVVSNPSHHPPQPIAYPIPLAPKPPTAQEFTRGEVRRSGAPQVIRLGWEH